MLALLASVAILSRGDAAASRFDVAERLQSLDFEWQFVPDKQKHADASVHVTSALGHLHDADYPAACSDLDEAYDVLAGRPRAAADAITLRFDPPFAEPKAVATLKLSWAYTPTDLQPVKVSVGVLSIVATPGRDLTIEVHPESVVPELNQSPESGVLIPVTVGEQTRSVYLSVVKGLRVRAKAALATTQPEAKTLAERVVKLTEGGAPETERALIQMLFSAELLSEGRQTLDRIDEISLVHSGSTDFRIAFPNSLDRKVGIPATVVLALPDTGASENAFFERYGHGAAVQAALQRGWIFASAGTSTAAPRDILAWITSRRHLKIGHVLLIGHGQGGTDALAANVTPTAVALFSPTTKLGEYRGKLCLTFAKQDLASLQPQLEELRTALVSRGERVEELDSCDHLSVVADGMAGAYRFFDSSVSK